MMRKAAVLRNLSKKAAVAEWVLGERSLCTSRVTPLMNSVKAA